MSRSQLGSLEEGYMLFGAILVSIVVEIRPTGPLTTSKQPSSANPVGSINSLLTAAGVDSRVKSVEWMMDRDSTTGEVLAIRGTVVVACRGSARKVDLAS